MSNDANVRKQKNLEIETKAVQTLKEVGLYSYPVDVFELSKRLGIDVYNAKFDNPAVSGMIRKEGGRKAIYFNREHHQNRTRFTIAHELGHAVLGHLDVTGESEIADEYLDMFRRDDDYSNPDYRYEVEANKFAAAILMPKEFVLQEWKSSGGNIEELARRFCVSEIAMGYRVDYIDAVILGEA